MAFIKVYSPMGVHVGTMSVIIRNFFHPEDCRCTIRCVSVRDRKGIYRYMGNVYFERLDVATKALEILRNQAEKYQLDTDAYLYDKRAGMTPERINEFHYRYYAKGTNSES